MVHGYNFYNFEASFKQYLIAGNKTPVSVKNYLSDLRHFFGWMTFYLVNDRKIISTDLNESQFISAIDEKLIVNYKSYLIENNIPAKTINRRLSTVRRFCSFCVSQGWMTVNPGKQIANIQSETLHIDAETKSMLDEYRSSLQQKQNSQHSITNSLNDIEEFLHIISS